MSPEETRSGLPAEMARRLEARLDAFLASDAWDPEVRSIAAHLRALPLYADGDGCLLLRPDGSVLFVGSDQGWSGPVIGRPEELDARWRIQVLASAGAMYPELADVLEVALLR